jgi:type IV pilus assembly protein PilW
MLAIQTKQKGIGLIELMIALTISLFLMIGLGTAYFGMRQNSTARSSLSQLQDQQRTAMNLIAGAIQQAGYFPDPLVRTNVLAFPLVPSTAFAANAAGAPVAGTNTSFSVRYVTDASPVPIVTCKGMSNGTVATPPYTTYIDTYSVSNGTLNCNQAINGVAQPAQSLVAGVSGMTVLFGVDVNGDGSAYQYQSASAITANTTDWNLVKSARVTLTFNVNNAVTGQAGTTVFTRTFALMNKL